MAPPSFDAILIGMNHHLVVEEAAVSHGLDVQEILNIRNGNKINDLDSRTLVISCKKLREKNVEEKDEKR